MNLQTVLYAAAGGLLVVFAILGLRVSAAPLNAMDAKAVYFRGQATAIALIFTKSGRSKGVTLLCVSALVLFWIARWPIWIPMAMILSQIFSQTLVELIKARYVRTRPDYWLVGLEAGHSYPSGHATTAIIFFAGWALVAVFSPLPIVIKYTIAAVLALWAVGVSWSRLALGAHYLSDVLGGTLFGTAWLCALAATLHVTVHAP